MQVNEQMIAEAFLDGFSNGNGSWKELPEHHRRAYLEGARSVQAALATVPQPVEEVGDLRDQRNSLIKKGIDLNLDTIPYTPPQALQDTPVAQAVEPIGYLVRPKGAATKGTFFGEEPLNDGNVDWENYEIDAVYATPQPFSKVAIESFVQSASDYNDRGELWVSTSPDLLIEFLSKFATPQPDAQALREALELAEEALIDAVTQAKADLEMNAPYPKRRARYERELAEKRKSLGVVSAALKGRA